MTLKETISQDLKEAMKAKDSVKLSVLRMLTSAFLYLEVSGKAGELTDKDYEAVVKKEAKKLEDAIEAYKVGGRPELQAKEEGELAILSAYLPEMMPEAEVAEIVSAVVSEMGGEMSNMGKIIGEVMKRTEGKADGGMISKLVREKLG